MPRVVPMWVRAKMRKEAAEKRLGIVIPKSAIKKFMERPRVDYRVYKEYSEAKLDRMMEALEAKPPIWWKLTLLQKVCFILGAKTRRFFFLNDTGTGKTLLSIALVRFFRKIGLVRHVLILVPNRINKTEWSDQLDIHSPKSSYLILAGSSEKKWADLQSSDALFVFETYMGLVKMCCDLKEVKRRGKAPKVKLVPNKSRVNKLVKHFQGIIGDESTAVKNSKKLPYRICRFLSKHMKIAFMLTGTPFNRDPIDIWSQMFLVDGGETLGQTMGLFRAAFYSASVGHMGQVEYKFEKENEEALHRFLANRSISYEADAASLPAVVPMTKYVVLPEDAEIYYERAKRELIAAKGSFEEMKNIFLRMRQISSGFIGYRDDETGEKARFVFPRNPKLEMLSSTLQSIRPDHKSIVFCDFNYSIEKIGDELDRLGIGHVAIYGKIKDVAAHRDEFKTSKKKQVLLLQNSMGKGLNIQVAKYGHFYESPVSAIDRKQNTRRVERQHSLHKSVFIIDYVTRSTMDETILAFHAEGADLFKALIRGDF